MNNWYGYVILEVGDWRLEIGGRLNTTRIQHWHGRTGRWYYVWTGSIARAHGVCACSSCEAECPEMFIATKRFYDL